MSNMIFQGLQIMIAGRFKNTSQGISLCSFFLAASDLFQGALSSAITQNGGRIIVNFKDSDLPSHLCLSESEFTKASNPKGWIPLCITLLLTVSERGACIQRNSFRITDCSCK